MPKYVNLKEYTGQQIAAIVALLRERNDNDGLFPVAVGRKTFVAIGKLPEQMPVGIFALLFMTRSDKRTAHGGCSTRA